MMGEFIFRFLQPADLQDRQLTQPRVELALEADIAADAAEGARHVGRVDQQLVQVGVALEHVAIFGRDLIGLEIGQAGHLFGSPLLTLISSLCRGYPVDLEFLCRRFHICRDNGLATCERKRNTPYFGAVMNNQSQSDDRKPYSPLLCILLLLTVGIIVKTSAAIHAAAGLGM